eukprot:6526890-Pyramimonas_sp.AAC.1
MNAMKGYGLFLSPQFVSGPTDFFLFLHHFLHHGFLLFAPLSQHCLEIARAACLTLLAPPRDPLKVLFTERSPASLARARGVDHVAHKALGPI